MIDSKTQRSPQSKFSLFPFQNQDQNKEPQSSSSKITGPGPHAYTTTSQISTAIASFQYQDTIKQTYLPSSNGRQISSADSSTPSLPLANADTTISVSNLQSNFTCQPEKNNHQDFLSSSMPEETIHTYLMWYPTSQDHMLKEDFNNFHQNQLYLSSDGINVINGQPIPISMPIYAYAPPSNPQSEFSNHEQNILLTTSGSFTESVSSSSSSSSASSDVPSSCSNSSKNNRHPFQYSSFSPSSLSPDLAIFTYPNPRQSQDLNHAYHLSSSSSSDTSSNKKRRRRLDSEETRILLEEFDKNNKPSTHIRDELARKLNMTSRAIQIWFQNRRAKVKRDVDETSASLTFSKVLNSTPLVQDGFGHSYYHNSYVPTTYNSSSSIYYNEPRNFAHSGYSNSKSYQDFIEKVNIPQDQSSSESNIQIQNGHFTSFDNVIDESKEYLRLLNSSSYSWEMAKKRDQDPLSSSLSSKSSDFDLSYNVGQGGEANSASALIVEENGAFPNNSDIHCLNISGGSNSIPRLIKDAAGIDYIRGGQNFEPFERIKNLNNEGILKNSINKDDSPSFGTDAPQLKMLTETPTFVLDQCAKMDIQSQSNYGPIFDFQREMMNSSDPRFEIMKQAPIIQENPKQYLYRYNQWNDLKCVGKEAHLMERRHSKGPNGDQGLRQPMPNLLNSSITKQVRPPLKAAS